MATNPDYPCGLPNVHVPFAHDASVNQSEFKMSTKTGMDKLKKGYSTVQVEDPSPPPAVIYRTPPAPGPWVHPARREPK